ncbi:MAG: Holliday junction branch migration protein RuvA [Bacteroidales bacterium]|nr:Holliday junction branch migration protein RuvA [Bacteroidales bacterium]
MIEYIEGKLVEKTPTSAVIYCGGVAYMIWVSLNTYAQLPQEGNNTRLYTHLQIKEDAHVLFGFANKTERQMFRQLITISGVGALTAQMMLSSMSVSELSTCIVAGNAGALQSIKGIGAKTAQRIVIELKDKLSKSDIVFEENTVGSNNTIKIEAIAALTSLGFKKEAVEKVINKLLADTAEDMTVEELIKKGLKLL